MLCMFTLLQHFLFVYISIVIQHFESETILSIYGFVASQPASQLFKTREGL